MTFGKTSLPYRIAAFGTFGDAEPENLCDLLVGILRLAFLCLAAGLALFLLHGFLFSAIVALVHPGISVLDLLSSGNAEASDAALAQALPWTLAFEPLAALGWLARHPIARALTWTCNLVRFETSSDAAP